MSKKPTLPPSEPNDPDLHALAAEIAALTGSAPALALAAARRQYPRLQQFARRWDAEARRMRRRVCREKQPPRR